MSSDAPATERDGDRDLESARASAYRLLATLLARPPTPGLLDTLSQIDAHAEAQGAVLAPAWRTLALAARSTSPEEADDEYHDLFIGMVRGELVPYGSWYLTGFMMEKPLAQLRQDLKQLGFTRQEDVKEPEDHAAALCETMSLVIADPDIAAVAQRRFFEEHLATWMFKFFEDLQNAASAKFYSAVGVFGAEFMEIDRQYLGMVPH